MILPDVNDKDMYNELCKAYELAVPYRTRVQYIKDILCHPDTIIAPEVIYNLIFGGCLIDAQSKFINTATWLI